MPSTIGHLIAGATIAWASDATGGAVGSQNATSETGFRYGRLTLACAGIAAAPDLDLLLRTHRTYSHSLGATLVVAFLAAAIAAHGRLSITRVVLVCAAAHASHILLDWLAVDRTFPYGIQALWPLSSQFYISGLDLFRQTERRHLFSGDAIRTNGMALAQELLILGPVAWAVWLVRVKALAGFSTKMPRGDHATQ